MIETPSGIQMIEKIEQADEAIWLAQVEERAAEYRKAQNAAQDASEGLSQAISAARAAGVPEARILSVATV
jgi:hypothetical protein